MKKNILNVIYCCLFFSLFACDNQSTDNNGKDIDNKVKINSHLLTAAADNSHIYNRPGQTDRLVVTVKQEELNAILKINAHPKLTITTVVSNGDQLISIDNTGFDNIVINNGSIAPIITTIRTTCKEDGKCAQDGPVSIKFFVNGVEQDSNASKIDLLVSDRSIRFQDAEQEHYATEDYYLNIYADHISSSDKFTVKIDAQGIEIENISKGSQNTDNYCTFSGANPEKPCTIKYKVKATGPYSFTAKIDEDSKTYEHQIIVCNSPQLIFKVVGNNYISVTDATYHAINFSVQRLCVSRTAPLPIHIGLKGDTIETEKTIADYIEAPETVTIEAAKDSASFVAKLKDVEVSDASLHLGDSFIITPTIDKAYGEFSVNPKDISTTIKDTATPFVELLNGTEKIDQFSAITVGEKQTVTLSTHKIDRTKLSFELRDSTKTKVDDGIATVTLTGDDVTVEVKDGLTADATYYVYATYDNNPISINGRDSISVEAKIKPIPQIKFEITPNNKHILNAYAEDDFYIKVLKSSTVGKSVKRLKDPVSSAYLYASDPQAGGCKDLNINKITITDGVVKETKCTLGGSDAIVDGDCGFTLAEADAKTVIFKITTPSTYQAENVSCALKIKTETSLDRGLMTIESTKGRLPITIVSTNSPHFNNASEMELWSRYHDSTSSSLNNNWGITTVDATSLMKDNSEVFDDIAIIKPLTVDNFAVDMANQTVTIKRYPGSNTLGRAVVLPRLNFMMRYTGGHTPYGDVGPNYWNNDRCEVNEDLFPRMHPTVVSSVPNLGCDAGGHTFDYMHGSAYIDQGTVFINEQNQLQTSGDSQHNVVIPDAWKQGHSSGSLNTFGITVNDQASYKLALTLAD